MVEAVREVDGLAIVSVVTRRSVEESSLAAGDSVTAPITAIEVVPAS